ncbi:MAG: SDR family NAD(P)-dependent oxidoreductase [Thiotrichaceae bacterium]
MQEQFDLTNKVVLITGGARRIGATVGRVLHDLGMNLVIHYRHSETEARALQDELHKNRENSVLLLQADLLHVAKLTRMVQQIIEHYGRLDVLINNASSFYPTPLGEVTEAQWDDLFGTNLKAPLFLSQAVATLESKTGLYYQYGRYSCDSSAQKSVRPIVLQKRVWRC